MQIWEYVLHQTIQQTTTNTWSDNCKFEHPSSANRNAASSIHPLLNTDHLRKPNNSNNRFVDLDSPQSSSAHSDRDGMPHALRSSSQAHFVLDLPYNITERGILIDLRNERPQWIFSAYGPGLKAPAQLFGGPLREQSFEETRLQFYLAAAEGNSQAAVRHVYAQTSGWILITRRYNSRNPCIETPNNRFKMSSRISLVL